MRGAAERAHGRLQSRATHQVCDTLMAWSTADSVNFSTLLMFTLLEHLSVRQQDGVGRRRGGGGAVHTWQRRQSQTASGPCSTSARVQDA